MHWTGDCECAMNIITGVRVTRFEVLVITWKIGSGGVGVSIGRGGSKERMPSNVDRHHHHEDEDDGS